MVFMIIPVVDMKDSMCVSGKSGMRDTYTELRSIYGRGCDIIDLASNLRDDGAKLMYIADLDKIEGVGDNSSLISKVNEIIPVMLDNGISTPDDIEENSKICTYNIVATETLSSISDAYAIFEKYDNEKLIFSVDIKDNEVLLKDKSIKVSELIELINDVKPKYVILLNITQVGQKQQKQCDVVDEIISKTPTVEHIMAGGITNQAIAEYKKVGIDNFLIGTILHEGKLEYEM